MSTKSLARHGLIGISALGCSVLFEPDALKHRVQNNTGGRGTGSNNSSQVGGVSRNTGSSGGSDGGMSFVDKLANSSTGSVGGSSGAATDTLVTQSGEPLNSGNGGDTTRAATTAELTLGLGGTGGVLVPLTEQASSHGGTQTILTEATSSSGGTRGQTTSPSTNGGTTTATSVVLPSGGSPSGGTGVGGTSPRGGTSSGGTSSAAGGSKPMPNLDGFASRYWNCCKPTCAWGPNAPGKTPATSCAKNGSTVLSSEAASGCDSTSGTAFICNWAMPWAESDNLAYAYALHADASCGTCYRLVFTGSNHNGSISNQTAGKEMFIQIIGTNNLVVGQFDLLIPGGGVGELNGCTSLGHQWTGTPELGGLYGGVFSNCVSGDTACVLAQCELLLTTAMPALMDGCKWFANWLKAADYPNVKYEQVPCPVELTQRSGLI